MTLLARLGGLFGLVLTGLSGCSGLGGGSSGPGAVSPDGRNEICITEHPLAYTVLRDGVVVVAKTPIGLKVNGKCLCEGAVQKGMLRRRLGGSVATPIYKKSSVDLTANETFFDYGSWGIRLVARDDGVAYRFETKMSGRIRVTDEHASVTVPDKATKCWAYFTDRPGCEQTVNKTLTAEKVAQEVSGKKFVYLPFSYTIAKKTVAVTESDVFDYPIWNLRANASACRVNTDEDGRVGIRLGSTFARWPAKQVRVGRVAGKRVDQASGGRWIEVRQQADYLVETEGTRTFPWRTFILADDPVKLCEADIVYALARPAAGQDFSWVKPGKVAWEWWNDWSNLGEEVGCTTATYRRYIDFAAQHGLEYVILDEGWSQKLDIWKFNPKVDVPGLIRYAQGKGVGIILWMSWAQVYGDEARVADHFSKLGAKGFKVDFMDRGDADAERFLWRFADACAKRRMIVDYHGSHRPTGQQRAYPNILNFEGVHGLECMKNYHGEDFMENDVKTFFCRMAAGPLDYTPGAMDNYKVGEYKGTRRMPGSMGTRCRQMAMMAMYEAPLQMLCDAPRKYEANLECLKFMAATPVVWDETIGLSGAPDSYAMLARRKGDVWYVAGFTDDQSRYVVINTDYLGKGVEWNAEIFRDTSTASEYPTQFAHEREVVPGGRRLTMKLARGGGIIMRFTKK